MSIAFIIGVAAFLVLSGYGSWEWYMFKRKCLRKYYMWYTARRAEKYKKEYEKHPTEENLRLYARAYLHWEISGINNYLDEMESTVGIRVCPKCQLPTRNDLCACEYCGHRNLEMMEAKDITAMERISKIFRGSRLYKPEGNLLPGAKRRRRSCR
ncbi:MAG: hypothetical protein KBA61_13615 [Spirochaetes bacterium]|nr:hypothetical protein [Spirochaetota bacterium]